MELGEPFMPCLGDGRAQAQTYEAGRGQPRVLRPGGARAAEVALCNFA